MKSFKSLKDNRTSATTKCNGAIMKTWYKLWWQNQNQICANIRNNDDIPNHHCHAHTCWHITTQLQYHCRPYLILNIDISVELAQQHTSCVDMTIRASQHKSRGSILPTHNINTSDHHTYPIHCHALHHHRTTTTSTTANMSDPNTHI